MDRPSRAGGSSWSASRTDGSSSGGAQAGLEATAASHEGAWDAPRRGAAPERSSNASVSTSCTRTARSTPGWAAWRRGPRACPVVRTRHVSIPIRRGWNPVYTLARRSRDHQRRGDPTARDRRRRPRRARGGDPGGRRSRCSRSASGRPSCRVARASSPPVIGSVAMFRGLEGPRASHRGARLIRESASARNVAAGWRRHPPRMGRGARPRCRPRGRRGVHGVPRLTWRRCSA